MTFTYKNCIFTLICYQTLEATNGTKPEVIEKLDPLPTQLYVTLIAPTVELFQKTARPSMKNAWEKVMETIELLPSLNTRKVIRLTLVPYYNMIEPNKYAKLFLKSAKSCVILLERF